jgi:fructosamine-3-kinase
VIVAGVELHDAVPVAGGDICRAYRARLTDGTPVFAKTLPAAPAGLFAAEARGLDRLRAAGGPRVPEVVGLDDDGLVLGWIETGPPTPEGARAFGRALAVMHAARCDSYGASADGFIGPLPLDNRPPDNRPDADWGTFYVERRVTPYLGALSPAERRDVEVVCARIGEVAGPPEPPALIHGDLWSGNLVWSADGDVVLVDAASVHGGHRETDLAMLALFGAPYLKTILAAYDEQSPLADGWRARVPLHQLHPLLVHATLFGGGYGARAAAAARAVLG